MKRAVIKVAVVTASAKKCALLKVAARPVHTDVSVDPFRVKMACTTWVGFVLLG